MSLATIEEGVALSIVCVDVDIAASTNDDDGATIIAKIISSNVTKKKE